MDLSKIKNRFFTRQQPGNTDPAHAFGSQEQIMAEFQRQQYIPPQEPPRSASERAGAALASIKNRLSRPARQYDTGAPTYTADTYDQPAAPDLGWNAAFDPGTARQSQPVSPAAPTAQQRFEAFRNTVYDSPIPRQYAQPYGNRPAPMYEEISFGSAPHREAVTTQPVYEEIRLNAPAQRENTYQKPVYEELDLTGNSRQPMPTEPPLPQGGTIAAQQYPPQEENHSSGQPIPGAAFQRAEAAPASDFQYFFWSLSILTGAVLTVFSFIYACVV